MFPSLSSIFISNYFIFHFLTMHFKCFLLFISNAFASIISDVFSLFISNILLLFISNVSFFVDTIFVSSDMYPENPEGTHGICI